VQKYEVFPNWQNIFLFFDVNVWFCAVYLLLKVVVLGSFSGLVGVVFWFLGVCGTFIFGSSDKCVGETQ
jgi:hypothetical protein